MNMFRSIVLYCLCVLVAGPASAADLRLMPLAPQSPATIPQPVVAVDQRNVVPLATPAAINVPNIPTAPSVPPMRAVVPLNNAAAPSALPALTPINGPGQAMKNQLRTADDVAMLRAENQRLRAQANALGQQLSSMKSDKPFCSDSYISNSKDGVQRDCSPTACDYETGTCIAFARSSDDCAPSRYWDGGSQCVPPPPPAPQGGL